MITIDAASVEAGAGGTDRSPDEAVKIARM
jgi:hypothetical protein